MGHQILYIADVCADEFCDVLRQHRVPHEIKSEFSDAGVVEVEFSLPGTPINVACELSELSVIWLPRHYSALLNGTPDLVTNVEQWEQTLVSLFPGKSIVRCDELLFDRWCGRHGDTWFHRRDLMPGFVESLHNEDERHWKELQVIDSGASSTSG